MGYLAVAAWVIQAAVGVSLLVSWARHARGQDAGLILTHVLMMVAFLVPWTAFLATGGAGWAWLGLAVLLTFIGFGDARMVRRSRQVTGITRPGMRDYWSAAGVALTGRLGWRVTVHALGAPVVLAAVAAAAIAAMATP